MRVDTNYNIIDVIESNITNINSKERVVLTGKRETKDSNYVYNLMLEVYKKDGDKIFSEKIPFSGYNLNLSAFDFNGDGKNEIVIRGGFGGSGGFEIISIYSYFDGKFKNIFNQDIFGEKYKFEAKYLDNYKVYVKSIGTNEEFIIDISLKEKNYLDKIYNKVGKVDGTNNIVIDAISSAYPIKSIYKNAYSLILNQRIIGIYNADTLGIVQSYVDFENNNIKIIKICILIFGEEISKENKVRENKEEDLRKLFNKEDNKDKDYEIYMYYLTLAQYKSLSYKEAFETITKALKQKCSYPSSKELKKLKDKIKRHIKE